MIRDEVLTLKGHPLSVYIQLLRHVVRFGFEYESEPDEAGKEHGPLVIESEPISVTLDYTRTIKDFEALRLAAPQSHPEAYDDYAKQVIEGKNAEGFEYSYYERLFRHPSDIGGDNQIEFIIKRLQRYKQSRRALAATWYSPSDLAYYTIHTPCLQLVQFWTDIQTGKLEMQTVWRSRDMYKAFPMNVWAMLALFKLVSDSVGVEPGIYRDFSIHPHVYKNDVNSIKKLVKL